jgi:hypothetical protein
VLEEVGIEAFLAHDHLQVSDEWRDRIVEELKRCVPRPVHGVRMVMLNDRHIEIRCGDCVIGMVDFDASSSRLRVILGHAYIGTEVPHTWAGGPAAIEIDLRRGIEEMGGPHGTPERVRYNVSQRGNHVDHDGSRSCG